MEIFSNSENRVILVYLEAYGWRGVEEVDQG